jgi:hypothetical protein
LKRWPGIVRGYARPKASQPSLNQFRIGQNHTQFVFR